MMTTFQRHVEEAKANWSTWGYPPVPHFHITDDTGNISFDPECMLHTSAKDYSAVRYRVWFMDKFLVTEGIVPRPMWKGSNSLLWYNSPPDEQFDLHFEGHDRLNASMCVVERQKQQQQQQQLVTKGADAAPSGLITVSPEKPYASLRHGDHHSAEMWIDWKLYARLSRHARGLPGSLHGVPYDTQSAA
jgi:hypothetical protein